MFDVCATLTSLRQPCLMRGPTAFVCNNEGVVKDGLFRAIDELLWEDIERRAIESSLPEWQQASDYTSDKWLTTSALQKCIRRGLPDHAERYARSSVRIDSDHAFRRMAIIALEDVGLGDLRLVAGALAILGDKRRRQRVGEERLAALMAKQMSKAVKSRLACEMLSIADYDPDTTSFADTLRSKSAHSLIEEIKVDEFGSTRQIVACLLLHGTLRLATRNMPALDGVGFGGLSKLMTAQRAPLILHYIVRRGLSRCRDSLAIPYALITSQISELEFSVAQTLLPAPRMIGSYPSFAYDMHTRAGRTAIKSCAVNFTDCLGRLGVKNVGNLVFVLEGGRLDKRLQHPTIKISERAMQLEVFETENAFGHADVVRLKIPSYLESLRDQVRVSA